MSYNDHFAGRVGTGITITRQAGLGGDRIDASKTPRNLSDITGITIHQMAFEAADAARCRRVRAHYCVLQDGSVIKNYEHNVYVKASNALSGGTIAIEFSGNFRSERGRWWAPSTHGRTRLTEQQVLAGRWLLRHLKRRLPNIRTVYAHKQANGPKPCCGPDVWYHIGQWAISILHWPDETHKTWDHYRLRSKDGVTVPQAWKTWDQI